MTIFSSLLALAAAGTPHLNATQVETPPVVDGRLDDAAWRRAEVSDVFTQKLPQGGAPPGERTIVRIVYDKNSVYVGVDCIQTKAEIVGRLTRRDRNAEADQVTVAFDSRGDGKTAFEFAVNASGVLSDGLHFNDSDYSQDWDENWSAQTALTPTGWSTEFRIPLRVLRFSARAEQSWGLQVKRFVSARQELDEWAYIPRDVGGQVSHYGRLDHLIGLRPGAPLELRPFVVGGVRHHDPEADTLARGYAPIFSAGLDLKWHISQDLTLDATFLPDFGQVDADQVVLNLTTFEQYYPEKRPFFLEGVESFNTPLQLLYTRRIGSAPARPVLPSEGPVRELPVHDPTPSMIYGAVKLTGELGHHFSVGELVAMTGPQRVEVQPFDGAMNSPPPAGSLQRRPTVQRLADPLTWYKILRVKRELGDNAHVGVIAMATNRLESGAEYPLIPGSPGSGRRFDQLCPSGDAIAPGSRCFHDAYVGGIDARWRSASGDYVASGQVLATAVVNGPDRHLPDGTVVRAGDTGSAVQALFAKEGGKHWTTKVQYDWHGRKVDYNDLGYMQRQNQHNVYADVNYRTLEPWGPTLETRSGIELREQDNLDGINLARSLTLVNFTYFTNFWGVYTELKWVFPRFDDREMGDGAALERAGYYGVQADVSSDSRKVISGELRTEAHFLQNGGFNVACEGMVAIRVLPQLDINLLPTLVYSNGEPRYVGLQDGSYVFGHQQAQSIGITFGSTYTFTPTLTLQAYGQLFLESQRYSQFLASPATGRGAIVQLDNLHPATSGFSANPNSQGGSFNANLVLRWEYSLGSTLYVVYAHGQQRAGGRNGFDFRLIEPSLAKDALLCKLSYWWG